MLRSVPPNPFQMPLFCQIRQILPQLGLTRRRAVARVFWFWVLLVASGGASAHFAGTFLSSQILSEDENRYSFQTFAGSQVVAVAPIDLPERISILVLPGHYSDRGWEEVEFRARQLASLENQAARFSLHVLADGALRSWETSPERLLHDLAGLRSRGADSTRAGPSEDKVRQAVDVYHDVGQHLPKPSVAWETLILFSPKGNVENEDLNSYCVAYLASQFSQEKVRLVYWEIPDNPTGASPPGGPGYRRAVGQPLKLPKVTEFGPKWLNSPAEPL